MNEDIIVEYGTRVIISEHEVNDSIETLDGGKVLLDQSNAIHSQNMARAISRALANEPNGFIHRIAFGNGGSFTDAGETTILNPPNDGTRGDGWESRLYNETYSEIIDEQNVLLGTDPGSSGPNSNRIGGGAVPSDDPDGAGVVSLEVGRKSNVIATMFINQSEPISQLTTTLIDGEVSSEEKVFEFDELGFYTTGKPASPQAAASTVDVGTKTSEDSIPASMFGSTFTFNYVVNGTNRTSNIAIPASGTGENGEVTYGDLCEGLNNGTWVDSGDDISILLETSITDRSIGALYPSIAGSETFGFLTFETIGAGSSSTLKLSCTPDSSNFLYAITNSSCSKVDTTINTGTDAGVANDPTTPENERERLLTHLTFSPILKKSNRILKIVYTLTVSVSQTGDCDTVISNASPTPSPTSTPTPTPTPSSSLGA